jgi:threonine-phosphate decarboxylase
MGGLATMASWVGEKDSCLHGGNLREAAERYRLKDKEIIDFSANINPLGFPQKVKEIISFHTQAISHYPDSDCKILKKALSQYLNINENNLLIGNGSMELIFLITFALRPKRTLIPIPAFGEYERAVDLIKGKCFFLKTCESNDFAIKVNEIVKHLSYVDLVFVCNPNNPTGFLFGKEELRFLANRCEKKGVFLIIDEAFMDFVKEKNQLSLIKYAITKSHVLVLQSMTKFFALAGLRLGYLIGNKTLLKSIKTYQPPWSVNVLAQLAGVEILKDRSFIKETRKYIFAQRKWLFDELKKLEYLKPYLPTANFIFCKLKGSQINAKQLCGYCGRKGVLIRDCSNFRGLDNHFIRIAVRKKEENSKLIKTLKELP